jgi:protein-disulfide isomerase
LKSGEVKLFIGICIAALLLVGVAVYPMMRGTPGIAPPPGPDPNKLTREQLVPAWSRMQGDPKAPYTLVEFGDYQCPACATGKYAVKDLLAKHKDKVNHVFHHVQITPEHRWAPLLARAAEAADRQGKFWELHRDLFDNQTSFKGAEEKQVIDTIGELAKKLGMDVVKLREDMNKPEAGKAVGQMEALARGLPINTTPTYLLIQPDGEIKPIGGRTEIEELTASPNAFK